MADSSIKIKLAVDKERNRVLFADAGSDLVDVLLSFLTLPLSAVQLVAGASSPGCLSTLCQGVSCLRASNLLRFDPCHGMLLRPPHEVEFAHGKYACSCYAAIVRSEPSLQGHGSDCRCSQAMARVAHVFNRKEGVEKFVKGNQRFVISDDLVIKAASTANTLSLLQRIDSACTIDHRFEEMEVCVGWTEVVSMLKASFSSKTVFTDTFVLSEKETKVHATCEPSIGQIIQRHQRAQETDNSLQFSIKVFYDWHEKKVMYAECDHQFVDLLLSFLVFPVARVTKNLAGTSRLGCSLDSLYGSAVHLHANNLLGGESAYYNRETLLDPSMAPFSSHRGSGVKRWFSLCSVMWCDCPRHANCTCSQFVNDATYVVDDDLLIYQASAMLVMKHWCNREKDRVLEMDIAIISKRLSIC